MTNTAQQISALHEILKWSESRPDWQRDALRRIITNGTLFAWDVEDLNELCRRAHGVGTQQNDKVPDKLTASHIPPSLGTESSVSLLSVREIADVNRLDSRGGILFGPSPGLTVIYGDNGTGKSSYARVIKKACRTRGALPNILPNAFSKRSGPSTATISFTLSGKEESVKWKDDKACNSRLANVFVFDSSTAENYLQEDGPATFTPYGLDVLSKLSRTCDIICQDIKTDIDLLYREIEASRQAWKYNVDSAVGKLMADLPAATTKWLVEVLSEITPVEKARLSELTETLRAEPKKKAKETRASKARLDEFTHKVNGIAIGISNEQVAVLKICIENFRAAKEAARAFASGQCVTTDLAGSKGAVWRKLWEAAREFSVSSAYVGKEFPFIGAEARCLLCQQDLDPTSEARLKAFDAFCKDRSQQLAQDADHELKKAADRINALAYLSEDRQKIDSDLSGVPEALLRLIDEFVATADTRLRALKDGVQSGTWSEPPVLAPSPAEGLGTITVALEERAKTEESADDPVVRCALEKECQELADRKWLFSVRAEVFAQIERHGKIERLEDAKRDLSTTGITTKNSELTELLVTDEFCARFKTEASQLGLRTLDVKLERVKLLKGETHFGLRFEADSQFSIYQVASEGEKRCISLAAFLAELSQASHNSALVFDDPVSSLDHWHRERIAKRLVEEAKTRQVIVFTHDAVFLNDLSESAEAVSIDAKYCFLEWRDGEPGVCCDGLPWDCEGVKDRLDKLGKLQSQIDKSWGRPMPTTNNIASMREAYSLLRATIERLVEREVLANVVFRFRSYVNLKELGRIVGFPQTECDEIARLFQRCCDVTGAHDPSQVKRAPVPEPIDLLNDLKSTSQLLATIKARQRAMKANP